MEAHDYFQQDVISGGLFSIQGQSKINQEHKYFVFSEPRIGMISFVTLKLSNLYLANFKQSAKKWREEKRTFKVHNNQANNDSKDINYLIISNFIRKNGF